MPTDTPAAGRLPAGVAAGHPATVAAGIEILRAGGTAADAAVAASLASCVAETVMTGLLGGGHAIHYPAGGSAEDVLALDFFVAQPGLGAERRHAELVHLRVPFGVEVVHYAVGIASCGVPGVPAGLKALWEHGGRMPWPRLVEPALRLARDGVPMPPAHAACLRMLEAVMTMREGGRIYAPGGRLLEAGEPLRQPGLVAALETLAAEGADTVYSGTLADALLALVEERGGVVTRRDLDEYAVEVSPPAHRLERDGLLFLSRRGLSPPLDVLAQDPPARLSTGARALWLVRALSGDAGGGHTTNVTVVDAEGSACVVTTSLGLGSGDWLPGYDLHLNSMLGEADLVVGELAPGVRLRSMMTPTIALSGDGEPRLAIGAAGGTRLRSALVQVALGVLDDGVGAAEAVERPRLHPTGRVVHVEPGYPEEALAAVAAAGYELRRWPGRHHYFGGVSLIAPSGAAGDPRRSGDARTLT